jgi:hypothetical protein
MTDSALDFAALLGALNFGGDEFVSVCHQVGPDRPPIRHTVSGWLRDESCGSRVKLPS